MVQVIEDSAEASRLNHLLTYFNAYVGWQEAVEAGNEELRKTFENECRNTWDDIVKNDFGCPNPIAFGEPSETARKLLNNGYPIDHCVQYLYWYIVDDANIFKKECRVHTLYHRKFTILEDIAEIRRELENLILETRPIFLNYEKRREAFNVGKDKWDKSYCHKNFSELVESAREYIGEQLAVLEEFATLPREAYLEITFEEICEKNVDGICKQFNLIRATAMKCLSFWKNESGFWDETAVKSIL